ncbi:hypothetical protein [Thalassolituus marinus]|uniref:Uncharacterized protein n=1 Tax=Thalassolituus marinus TaxID=671053 RepID=A0ABS7ZSQ2_9GAMM|nr:hypothetical protein [Thalassolituus marinus]MCA6064645.1 hypothetical protein [Thalassolituus marinus]
MIKLTSILLLAAPVSALAMQSLSESELGDVTGEGLGAVFDDVVIHSGDYGAPDDFKLRINLTEGADPESLIFSELRFYKTGTTPGTASSGGRFGTYDDPFVVADLREIQEEHIATFDPEGDGSFITGNKVHTALYTGFPAADETQLNRNFFSYSNGLFKPSQIQGATTYYQGLPQGFFTSANSINVGNLYSRGADYAAYLEAQELALDNATDKFNLHFRLDSVTDENRTLSADDQFLASVDVVGARLYGTTTYIWAHDNQGETLANAGAYTKGGQPTYADRGLALAMTTGLRADAIRITADPTGAASSVLELRGVDAYLPLGSVDQPLTISTVQYSQIQRGTWKNPQYLPATTQLRVEIAGLPQDVGQAPQGNIYIQSIAFGDENDPEIITGVEDIYLRDENGFVVDTVADVTHRAFVPKTVTYNEQVAIYNDNNPGNEIPFIPNQNVIEIKGIEIQRLVFTTQDL